MSFLKAYVQGDWLASPHVNVIGFTSDPGLSASYDEFLKVLEDFGIENLATWHLESRGVVTEKKKSSDAVRNTRQIDQADCVISYLLRDNPDKRHWGSLALMAYAIGKGKPCYLIASPDCVVWQSHFVYHPLVKRFTSVKDFLNHFQYN